MPAVKKSATTAVAKAKFSLPANLDKELAAEAAEIAKRVGSAGGSRIRPQKDRTFILPDGSIVPSPMPAVIVAFAYGNFFYDRPFNPDQPMAPACFALAADANQLTPSDNSPAKQSDSCNGCDNNLFKSDPNGGRGKACSNTVLLALAKSDSDDPQEPLAVLRASSTALKYFNGYIQAISNMGRPSYSVVTDLVIELLPGTGAQSLRFLNPQPLPNEILAVARSRREEAMRLLLTEPDVSGYQPFVAPAPRRGVQKPAAPAARAR